MAWRQFERMGASISMKSRFENGAVDFKGVRKLTPGKVVRIQRSRGYASRPSFTVAQIKEMCDFVKAIDPEITIFVDNCYGEFAEELEPTQVGADLMAGSLD